MMAYVAQMSLALLSLIPPEIRNATYIDGERYPEVEEPGVLDTSTPKWVQQNEAAIGSFGFLVDHLSSADRPAAVHRMLDALEEATAVGDRMLPGWFGPIRSYFEVE